MSTNCIDIASHELDNLVRKCIKTHGLISHHIESYNKLMEQGIAQILQDLFHAETTVSKPNGDVKISINFANVRVESPISSIITPKSTDSNAPALLRPSVARNNKLDYVSVVKVSVTITLEQHPINGDPMIRHSVYVEDYELMKIPVMLKSKICNTYGKSWDTLLAYGEDPLELGGYFVLHGTEWAIDCVESAPFNQPRITYNIGHKDEVSRLQILCKPGDGFENSSDIIIRCLKKDKITIEFTSVTSPPIKLSGIQIPIFIVFRLFGMLSDEEIFDNITYRSKTPTVISTYISQVLRSCVTTKDDTFGYLSQERDPGKLRESFVRRVAEINHSDPTRQHPTTVDELAVQFAAKLDAMFEKYMFPQMHAKQNHVKLRYMGHLIHNLLLVRMGVNKPADLEHLKNKRILTAGYVISKDLKKNINTCVIQPSLRSLENEVNNYDNIAKAELRTAFVKINNEKLTKAITKSIASSKSNPGDLRKKIASEAIPRKNNLYTISVGRLIRSKGTPAKASQRSMEMRSKHPSYLFSICNTQSADTGDQIGLVKQMGILTIVSPSGDSTSLKLQLWADPDIIKMEMVLPNEMSTYTKIFVNGAWIGCCSEPYKVVHKYRELRRGYVATEDGPIIYRKFTKTKDQLKGLVDIDWDTYTNCINFWIDAGRLMFPLLVVRNNTEMDPIGQQILKSKYDAYADKNFVQDVTITRTALLDPETTLMHFIENGDIEYVSASEADGLLIASSLEVLAEHRTNPLNQYTHCGIPLAMMGLVALTSPYMSHNQSPRVVYQTNQAKQTNGIPSLAYAERSDKSIHIQWMCQRPLIETIANDYTYPNGANVIVAIYNPNGNNQEDSIIGNATSSQRGLFATQHIVCETYEIDTKERIGVLERETNSNLQDGMPIRGKVLHKGDTILGLIKEAPNDRSGTKLIDVSPRYEDGERIRIENSYQCRNYQNNDIAVVKYSSARMFGVGHKFSSRHGQKAMTGEMLAAEDMPYTATGLIPDIILSPHAIPSRMTIGQLLESIGSKSAALRGAIDRASAFTPVDYELLCAELESLGAYRYGTEPCYNGLTGEWIDCRILICPTFYQRLQKFVEEELYTIINPNYDPTTGQPVSGRRQDGGLRFGEMEKDCNVSHGAGTFGVEMTRDNSDPTVGYVCATCGTLPICNPAKNIYMCRMCENNGQIADIYAFTTAKSALLWLHELEACGVMPKLSVKIGET